MISAKWKHIAASWLGTSSGRHCHWCKYMLSEEGEVRCGNQNSQFCDGDRIRSWDGATCAAECSVFELDEWYTCDENFDKTFKENADD